jgi:hypothetical protein
MADVRQRLTPFGSLREDGALLRQQICSKVSITTTANHRVSIDSLRRGAVTTAKALPGRFIPTETGEMA